MRGRGRLNYPLAVAAVFVHSSLAACLIAYFLNKILPRFRHSLFHSLFQSSRLEL